MSYSKADAERLMKELLKVDNFEVLAAQRREIAKANRRASQLGLRHSEETKAKMSAAHRGRPKSDEARSNMSLAQKGRKMSDEQKQKLSEALKGKTLGFVHKKITCPHCGTSGGETSTRRWHFDNCKFADPKVVALYEEAIQRGPTAGGSGRASMNVTANLLGIDCRSLNKYIARKVK